MEQTLHVVRYHADAQTANNGDHDARHQVTWAWDMAGPAVARRTGTIKKLAKQLTRAYIAAGQRAAELAEMEQP